MDFITMSSEALPIETSMTFGFIDQNPKVIEEFILQYLFNYLVTLSLPFFNIFYPFR